MQVSDEVAAAMRALLRWDDGRASALASRLGREDALAYNLLFDAVLMVTAGKRFADGYTDGDVIQYVARIRGGRDMRGGSEIRSALDPKTAEDVLRRALGKPVPMVKDAAKRFTTMIGLLTVLFTDLEMDTPGTDAILTEARSITDQWLLELPSAAAE